MDEKLLQGILWLNGKLLFLESDWLWLGLNSYFSIICGNILFLKDDDYFFLGIPLLIIWRDYLLGSMLSDSNFETSSTISNYVF